MRNDPCTWTVRDDVFEAYVRGALSATEREAFEDHYFVCATCLAKLRAYEGFRAELNALPTETPAARPVRTWRWRWALVPVAAGLVLVASVALWLRGSPLVAPKSDVAVAPAFQTAPGASPAAPSAPGVPVAAPVVAQPGQTAPAPKQPKQPPASPVVVALSVLARVEAAPYAPAVLRGPHDEAAAKFDAAMRPYIKRDYAAAIPGLDAAAALSPDVPQYAFFLGVCHLMTDHVALAVVCLQKAIAIGESPYLEDAHFYLAKARLRQGDIPAARDELERTIERQGRLEADARRLLAQVNALPQKR